MKLLADECCDAPLVRTLREAGHDVRYVAEFLPGASDHDVIACSRVEGRVLLTEDKDFGELVYRLQFQLPGLILLRYAPDEKAKVVRRLLSLVQQENRLLNKMAVVQAARVRLRALMSS